MKTRTRWLRVIPLVLLTGLFAYPFVWMGFSSFEASAKGVFNPLRLWPEEPSTAAYTTLGELRPSVWLGLFNSVFIAALQALLATSVTALAGYAFSRRAFRGRSLLLFLCLLPILIPRQILALPLAEWLVQLRLANMAWGVILPGAVSGLGLLYFLHVFRQVPKSLLDAAMAEGASELRVFSLVLPMVSASLVTYGLIHFILAWHEHLVPLLVLHSPERQTLPIMLSGLNDPTNHIPKSVLFAASTCAVAPVMLFFALGFRQFRHAMSELSSTL